MPHPSTRGQALLLLTTRLGRVRTVAIPNFQALMRPLLELHADDGEKTQGELREALAEALGLTQEELAERIPSGTARRFVNRVAWASTHMTQAGLIAKPRRGISVITPRGMTALRENPARIDMAVLEQFPEYIDFRTRASGRRRATPPGAGETSEISESSETPDEAIDAAYQVVRAALAEQLLARLVERDDRFFEEVVLDVLLALGYGGSKPDAAERVGRSGDGGIDGVIREDTLGLDAIYVQAKKWALERGVGPREIREFIGALQDVEATKGIFITTSGFSSEARELARRRRIVLIDGFELAEHMIDAGVGVTTVQVYTLKRINEDYFVEAQ
jgi:restriction system protein